MNVLSGEVEIKRPEKHTFEFRKLSIHQKEVRCIRWTARPLAPEEQETPLILLIPA